MSGTENSLHSSPLTSGPSSAPSSAPSSSSVRSGKKPEEVIVDVNGTPVGGNSSKISSLIGKLVASHIPIYYAEWKKVPRTYKNDVWNELLKRYDLREISRSPIDYKMSVSFKKRKYRLRCENYKTKGTQEERKKNVPKNTREEDWLAFCANENTERAEEMSKQNKKNRAMLTCPHATGRTGHAQIEAEMRAELDDAMEDIPRHETWVKVRTRKDGTIVESALPIVEKINEILKTQDENSKGSQSLENDVLAQAINKKESRGRVRGKSGTSKTKLNATQALRAQLVACQAEKNELKTHLNDSRQQINDLGSRFSRFESFMDEMRGKNVADPVVSHAPSQGCSTSTTHTEFEHKENVAILNMAKKVVAHGTVVKDGTSRIVHGRELEDGEVKVLLDKIFLPDDILYLGTQGCADNYADVGIGGFVVHHKSFLKRIN